MQSRRYGILISYLVLGLKTVFRFILTHLYLKILGSDEYGFYQYIYSIAAYATILDFGVGSVINKFGIEFKQKGDVKGYKNILFYCICITAISSILIIFGSIIIIHNIKPIYGVLSDQRLALARKIILYIILQLISLLFQHYYEGIILSEEKYVTLKLVNLAQVVIQGVCIIVLLYCSVGVISIAIGDVVSCLICLIFEFFYSFYFLKRRAKFYYFDKKLFFNILKLALALCMQSIILYMNSTIDKYVLGRQLENTAVTVYTIAMTFSTFFDEIPTIIQRLYLPEAVKRVSNGADGNELTDFTIKPGRIQFILCCTMLGGFFLFGKHFLLLWSGEDTLDAWWIALLLMIPSVVPLTQNTLLSVLTAKNMRMYRSSVLFFVAIGNLIMTICLVPVLGIAGAPIGTFIALIIGNNLAMNLYYKKRLGIKIAKLFRGISNGILPCWLIATLMCFPLTLIEGGGLLWLLLKCIIYIFTFFYMLYIWGFNSEEKLLVTKLVNRFT